MNTNNRKLDTDETANEFLEPSENSSYLEDIKRVKDINNTKSE